MAVKTKITFQTADQANAGTDSNIFVTFYGLKGDSKEFRMQDFADQNGHSDLFERGDDNAIIITHDRSLGMLYKVDIRSDGRYSGSGRRLSLLLGL